jgi:hypothetical protein
MEGLKEMRDQYIKSELARVSERGETLDRLALALSLVGLALVLFLSGYFS